MKLSKNEKGLEKTKSFQRKIFLVLIIGIFLIGCTDTPTGNDIKETPIKIGVVLPLTGPSSDGGQYTKEGIELALEDINAKGQQYELIFEDSHYDPKQGVNAIQKLINLDNVNYVLGAHGSSVSLSMAPVAEENKVIQIITGSQSELLSESGDYIFRIQITYPLESKFFSKYVYEKIGNEKIDLIVLNTAYGKSVIKNFKDDFEGFGGEVGLVQEFDAKETDFRSYLLKIKDSGSKYVLVGATRRTGGEIIRQAKEMDLDVKFFSTSVLEGEELVSVGGEAVEGLIYPYPYDGESTLSSQARFRSTYNKKYGRDPEMLAANGYDALYLLTDCIAKFGDNTDAVKTCLYMTKDYNGAGGIFSIDKNGDAAKSFIVKTVRDGEFVKVEG